MFSDPLVLVGAGLLAAFAVGVALVAWSLDRITRDVKDAHREEHERERR